MRTVCPIQRKSSTTESISDDNDMTSPFMRRAHYEARAARQAYRSRLNIDVDHVPGRQGCWFLSRYTVEADECMWFLCIVLDSVDSRAVDEVCRAECVRALGCCCGNRGRAVRLLACLCCSVRVCLASFLSAAAAPWAKRENTSSSLRCD
jgi:hypothetical protein